MSEEKSAPKKEKLPKKAAPPLKALPLRPPKPSPPRPRRTPSPPKARPAAPAADAKPVELVGGVPKAATAEDLLKEELASIKVHKAKGSKNISSRHRERRRPPSTTPSLPSPDAKGNMHRLVQRRQDAASGVPARARPTPRRSCAQDAARNAMGHGLKEVEVRVQRPGLPAATSAVRGLQALGLEICWRSSTSPRSRTTAAARASAVASNAQRNLTFKTRIPPWLVILVPPPASAVASANTIVGSTEGAL